MSKLCNEKKSQPLSKKSFYLDYLDKIFSIYRHNIFQWESGEIFTDPDTDSSVAIAYNQKTRLWSVTGILANTWRIEPYTFWSRPPACAADTCLPCSWHAVTRVNMTQLRGDGAADYVLADTEGADTEQLPRRARQYGASSTVWPEVLVMVDYSIFQSFGRSTAATRQYVIQFFNAVNFR